MVDVTVEVFLECVCIFFMHEETVSQWDVGHYPSINSIVPELRGFLPLTSIFVMSLEENTLEFLKHYLGISRKKLPVIFASTRRAKTCTRGSA